MMDLTPLRCLVNSISRFIHLVTCRASSAMPADKDYQYLASMLKHLKPVLDAVTDHKALRDEALFQECEELDIAVNEAREFVEKWSPRMSKILCVLQSKPLLLKIQISSVKLSYILCKTFESLPFSSSLTNAQFTVQECQNLKLGQLAEQTEEILKSQKEGKVVPDAPHLVHLIESFKLGTSEEILNEYIALEKEKQKFEVSDIKGDLDQVSQIVDLLSHIRDYVVNLDRFKAVDGVLIPSYFRCPLSLELMLDPVIVASGQTYERVAIQKWLDHGLGRCPKTGYELFHKNLIPNYTVKALIANWCSENRLDLVSEKPNVEKVRSPSEQISHEDDRRSPQQSGSSFECSLDSRKVSEEGSRISRRAVDKLNQSSPEHSYVHSRSESESSAVSSIDYVPTAETEMGIAGKQENTIDKSDDTEPACSTSLTKDNAGVSHSLHGRQCASFKNMNEMVVNGNYNPSRTPSLPSETEYNVLTSTSQVEELVNSLKSVSNELQTAAAIELRYLAKYNMENRIIIGECGAITPLITLLHSEEQVTQEHAVTALLNLSINENIKARIAEEGALEPLIHVLRTGNSVAKENAAATLFSISLLDDYRVKIGRSGAVKLLIDLLGSGTIRGKKDAATALFNLSIFHENKARIVQAGAVKHLVSLLDPASEMVDKAVALLANLSTIAEGCSAIAREGGIPSLVEIVDMGSQRGKENAASILLQLCISSPKYCRSILQEGAVPPLVALSQSGTPRAKEKAQQLLSHFRNQRENSAARGRS